MSASTVKRASIEFQEVVECGRKKDVDPGIYDGRSEELLSKDKSLKEIKKW